MSAFDWDGFDLLRGACEFAFPRIARGIKAGDAKAVVAGARSVLAVLGGCLPPAYASRVKSSLNLLPAVPAPFPPSAPVGDYAGVLQALDSVDRTRPPWGALGAVAGAVRMSLITARVTGPFDKLGSALLELTELGRESRTGAEGFKPPQAVADAAAKGLEYREKASPSNRGGLTPAEAGKQGIGSGVQRAVNLKNRDNVSAETISKMVAFFSRHEKNKGVAPEHKGKPWNDRGHVAWLLWGGDPGRAWAEGIKKQLDSKKTASHAKSIALMKFLSEVSRSEGVAKHVYVVGGAVRNYLLNVPIKDIDVVVDSVALGRGRDSEWFARKVADEIPAQTNLTTNQYGVAILTVKGSWILDGVDMKGEVIEIANARKESYDGAGGKGKGYKPTDVVPATIEDDVYRREFTFNTLLWSMLDLAQGPEKAEVIDLTGLGRRHLEERLISTPVDPDKTFSDDPTRQLRILKFLLRYDLDIAPEVMASVRRNAHKLKVMPWEAVASILMNDILSRPNAMYGLKVMRQLGILDVVVEMIQETPPFAAYLERQLASGSHSAELLLELADLGVAGRALSFLSPTDRVKFREAIVGMTPEAARAYLGRLQKPPVRSGDLIAEFALEGRDRGRLVPLARDALLRGPHLSDEGLHQALRSALGGGRTASYWDGYGVARKADLNPPLGVGGGPCLVVDRIRKRVRNPSLREGLIEEAESGELDNPSARKVYPLTEERGSLFKSFTITSHAQYRMDYRSITVADVTAALNNCAREFVRLSDEDPGRYDDLLNQGKITWLDPKTRLQLVFSLEEGTGEPVIISAYWKGQPDPPPAECPL